MRRAEVQQQARSAPRPAGMRPSRESVRAWGIRWYTTGAVNGWDGRGPFPTVAEAELRLVELQDEAPAGVHFEILSWP